MVPIEHPIAMSSSIKSQIKRWSGSQTFKFPSFELFRGRDQLKAIYLDPKDFKGLRTQERNNSGK